MNHSEYKTAKNNLRSTKYLLKHDTNDKPLIRQALNDTCDSLIRDLSYSFEGRRLEMYAIWLQNYTCKLHP